MLLRKKLKCSFCGKKETEVTKLVAGPRVFICDECVALAARIMQGESPPDLLPTREPHSLLERLKDRWRQLLQGKAWREARVVSTPQQALRKGPQTQR